MAEPLSAEERVAVCASGPLAIGEEYSQAAFIRYEVTCRALEAERDRLRAALEEIVSPPDASRGWDYGCLNMHEARHIARTALAPDPPAGT